MHVETLIWKEAMQLALSLRQPESVLVILA